MAERIHGQENGWIGRHAGLTGALILLGLHVLFVLGPMALSSAHIVSQSRLLPNAASLGEWTGLKHDAVPYLIGIVQLYYVIPAVLLTVKLKYPTVAKGIVHAALATFLLNAAGCGVFFWQLSKIGR